MADPSADIPQLVEPLRQAFGAGRTRPLAWREAQLRGLAALLGQQEQALLSALEADLSRNPVESWSAEVGFVAAEARRTLQQLTDWLRPQRVSVPLITWPGKAHVHREPLGVVLIIGPWNYPLQLTLAPLIGALAAGNCVVVKPSELAPHCAAALAELLPRYLDPQCVRVVTGGVPEASALLEQRFDHIFFTGGAAVGRIVMAAAARHLTPVTLELGGKSPCIVDDSVDLKLVARRIAWGKFLNAGQTCVAPDYLLVQRELADELVQRLRASVEVFYGPDPRRSPDYPRIINDRHFARLRGLLSGGRVEWGGQADAQERYLAPTLLRDVDLESPLMTEEIFGPLLPLVSVSDMEQAVAFVNARPRPLALYLFSRRRRTRRQVIGGTSSGGVCVNDTITHLLVPGLPFGGVGDSGMGAYHGRATFETFSHRRGVLAKSTRFDPPMRYPPYDQRKLRWIKRIL
jgi:aldehyde dehydrogenase (NAD+)